MQASHIIPQCSMQFPITRDWVLTPSRPVNGVRYRETLRIADIFSGCGGMTLGALEAAHRMSRGCDIRLAIDWAELPLTVFRNNFGCSETVARTANLAELLSDVGKRMTPAEVGLRHGVGELDLLMAGPPCQGHSDLNNSSRREDPRNGLYLKVVRAAKLFKPKVVFIENVPTVIHDVGRAVESATAHLETLGFHVREGMVSMLRLGLPQRRKRHLMIACQGEPFDIDEFIETLPDECATVSTFLSGIENEPNERPEPFFQPSRPTPVNAARIQYLFKHRLHDLPNEQRPPCHRDKEHAYVSMYGRMHWDKPAQTLTSGFGSMGQGRYVHPTRPRLITPHEAARLQGFPDYFDFTGVSSVTALREMIANAVPPPLTLSFVAEFIRRKLL